MASFSCSLIISWSKQPANFQSFTELYRGGIQNNSNWITARRILVTSSDELYGLNEKVNSTFFLLLQGRIKKYI